VGLREILLDGIYDPLLPFSSDAALQAIIVTLQNASLESSLNGKAGFW